MKLGHYPIILGIPRLWLHHVAVWFASNAVIFRSQYCTTPCHDAPVMVQGVTEKPPQPVHSPGGIFEPEIYPERPFRGNIILLNGSSIFMTVQKRKLKLFTASVYDINKTIEAKDVKERPLEEIVPRQYHEFLPVFNTGLSDGHPPHLLGIDHEVHLNQRQNTNPGTSVRDVKGNTGSSQAMVRGEYVDRIHPSIIITHCSTSPVCEETEWRAPILYWLSRYQPQDDKQLKSTPCDHANIESCREISNIYRVGCTTSS